MWHQKQNTMGFPAGRVIRPPLGPQETFMEDAMHLASSGVSVRDLWAEPSRKRKILDQQGSDPSDGVPQLLSDYSYTSQPNQHHNVAASLGMNPQGNALGMFSNQISPTAEPTKKVFQFGWSQYHRSNNIPWSPQINNRNASKTTFEYMSNSCSNAQYNSLHPEILLALINPPAGKIPALHDSQLLEYNILSPIEAHNLPSHLVRNNMNIERSQSDHNLKDSLHFGDRNHVLTGNSPLEFPSKPSQGFGSSDLLVLKSEQSHHINSDGGKSIQEVHESNSSSEVKQSNKIPDMKKARDASRPSTAGTGSSGSSNYIVGKTTDQSCKMSNGELKSSAPENGVAAKMEGRDQSNAGLCIQNTGKTKELNVKIMNNSLGEKILNKNSENSDQSIVDQRHGIDSHHSSCDLDGKRRVRAGNVAPTIAEKLWDGSLQLNASVKVSAVAFFKSGEKAPGIHWSQSIEVKGKVKLQAFEKFIQELPRSRSRGLMVTSLCWKVGSSEAGLAGMKEVAKGYKDGERVGFAQLSLGIDLYVCPRSDTIITILAKYGFFKGMAAIEDDQDSLIGCVVWRRQRSSLDSVSKKFERKNLPLTEQSPSAHLDTKTQLDADASTHLVQVSDSSIPLGNEEGTTAPESKGNNIQSNKAQAGVGDKAVDKKLIPPVPDISSVSSCVLQLDNHSNSNNLKGSVSLEGEAIAVPVDCSVKEKPPTSHQILTRSLLPLQPQNAEKWNKPAQDDDDLPEFDFSAACGVSHSPLRKPSMCINNAEVLSSASLEGKVLAHEAKNVADQKVSMPCIVPQTVIASHNKSETPFPVQLDTSQGISSQNKLGEDEYHRMVQPFPGRSPVAGQSELSNKASICKTACNSVLPTSKSLWDYDDDDMPEWCPPVLEQRDQQTAVPTLRHSVLIAPSSLIPNLTSENRPQAPPMPLLSPALQTQGLLHRYQHCPITRPIRPAQNHSNPAGGNVQFGPRSTLKLNPSSSMTPRPNIFDARRHMPGGWRP